MDNVELEFWENFMWSSCEKVMVKFLKVKFEQPFR